MPLQFNLISSCSSLAERRSNDRFGSPRLHCAKHFLERRPQRDIDVGHGHGMAEIDQAGDAVAWVRHAARHDRLEMRQIGLDIDGDAVE